MPVKRKRHPGLLLALVLVAVAPACLVSAEKTNRSSRQGGPTLTALREALPRLDLTDSQRARVATILRDHDARFAAAWEDLERLQARAIHGTMFTKRGRPAFGSKPSNDTKPADARPKPANIFSIRPRTRPPETTRPPAEASPVVELGPQASAESMPSRDREPLIAIQPAGGKKANKTAAAFPEVELGEPGDFPSWTTPPSTMTAAPEPSPSTLKDREPSADTASAAPLTVTEPRRLAPAAEPGGAPPRAAAPEASRGDGPSDTQATARSYEQFMEAESFVNDPDFTKAPRRKLRSTWKEIRAVHARLAELEESTRRQLEAVLTPNQLARCQALASSH